MKMRRFPFILALALAASACSNPVLVPSVTVADHQKDCPDLLKDIEQTRYYRKEARADDKFMWKHIFIFNAFVSAYRMNEAESAANTRLGELERTATAKGCFNPPAPALKQAAPTLHPTTNKAKESPAKTPAALPDKATIPEKIEKPTTNKDEKSNDGEQPQEHFLLAPDDSLQAK